MTKPTASPLAVWTGLIVIYLVWGSTYLGMKVAIGTIPPFVMGFIRFVPAGILLVGLVVLLDHTAIRRPSRQGLADSAIVGGCLLLGGTGLVAWGEQTIPTGIAALMIGLTPMWLAIFGRVLFGDRVPMMAAAGIVVGILGVAILAWPAGGVDSLDPAGLLALMVAPVFWSLGSLYAAKRAVLPVPALFATGIEMIAGGLAFLVAAILTRQTVGFDLSAVSAESWAGIVYLVVVGSLVGFTTYSWLLTVAPLPRLATYAYVNPVVAVILGSIILGETLTPRTIVAAVVITVAVMLIVTARGRVAVTDAPEHVAATGTAQAPTAT